VGGLTRLEAPGADALVGAGGEDAAAVLSKGDVIDRAAGALFIYDEYIRLDWGGYAMVGGGECVMCRVGERGREVREWGGRGLRGLGEMRVSKGGAM